MNVFRGVILRSEPTRKPHSKHSKQYQKTCKNTEKTDKPTLKDM
jgi:hypothetical protein